MSETAFGMVMAFSPVLVASTVLLVLAGIDRRPSVPDIADLFSATILAKEAHERALEAVAKAQAAADAAATQRQQAAQALMEALGIANPIVVLDSNLDQHLRSIGKRLDLLMDMVKNVQQSETKLMATSQDALDLLKKINDATNQQGSTLATTAQTLQAVSDNIDAILAQLASQGTNVPADVMAALQSQADHVAALSTSVQQQADFSTALASKTAQNPVPVPVPPVPPPAPTPPQLKKP